MYITDLIPNLQFFFIHLPAQYLATQRLPETRRRNNISEKIAQFRRFQ